MLGVVHGFVEELCDVVVVEGVHDAAPAAFIVDQAEVAQESQLVGDRGAFHADGVGEVADCRGSLVQPAEDEQATGGGQCLQRGGHRLGGLQVSGSSIRKAEGCRTIARPIATRCR